MSLSLLTRLTTGSKNHMAIIPTDKISNWLIISSKFYQVGKYTILMNVKEIFSLLNIPIQLF